MNNILCTLCMRGGSKGVPNKNTAIINGKPLLYYSLKQAKDSKLFSKIVVSTDSDKIFNISKKYGAECWFKRPKYLSTDKTAKLPVIRHALLKSEKNFKQTFDIIFDLDVTSPLRTANDIQYAYKKFIKENSNNLISATPANKNPYFNQIQFKKNKYDVVLKKKNIPIRRQDAPKIYDMNASIYIWKRNILINSNNLFTKKTSLYIMPPERSCDIDTLLDLEFVKFILTKKKY